MIADVSHSTLDKMIRNVRTSHLALVWLTVFLKFNLELIQFELIHELIQKNYESESNRFIFEKGESEFLIDSNFPK